MVNIITNCLYGLSGILKYNNYSEFHRVFPSIYGFLCVMMQWWKCFRGILLMCFQSCIHHWNTHIGICIHAYTYMHICIHIKQLLCLSLGHVTFQKRMGKRNKPADLDCHTTSAHLVYWQWLWDRGTTVTPATIFAPIIVARPTIVAFVSNT